LHEFFGDADVHSTYRSKRQLPTKSLPSDGNTDLARVVKADALEPVDVVKPGVVTNNDGNADFKCARGDPNIVLLNLASLLFERMSKVRVDLASRFGDGVNLDATPDFFKPKLATGD